MRNVILLGISAAVSVGFMVWFASAVPAAGLIPWISLVSAGAYFTAGGGEVGLTKPMAAGTLGILLTAVALTVAVALAAGQVGFALVVACLAFTIILCSALPVFSHIPSAFMAASCYVGASGSWKNILLITLSWGVGLALAWIIDRLSQALMTARALQFKRAEN